MQNNKTKIIVRANILTSTWHIFFELMNKLESAKVLAAKTRANPYKSAVVAPTTILDDKSTHADEPLPQKQMIAVEPEVFRLPTYNPQEFAQVDYMQALSATESICARVSVTHNKTQQQLLAAKIILVQMHDTLGTHARVFTWLHNLYGERVFEYQDEALDSFLSLIQTGHSFDVSPTLVANRIPVAVFFYPTAGLLEQLSRCVRKAIRIVVILDDIYCSSAKALRHGSSTTAFINPLPRAIIHECLTYLRNAWNLSTSPARQDYWLSRAADDPRILLHMLYFERLDTTQQSVAWGKTLDWDWFRWVNFWNRYGMQNLYELHYEQAIGLTTATPGVISRQMLGNGKMSFVAWGYANVPRPVSRTELSIDDSDLDVDMTLSYLHYTAPAALEPYIQSMHGSSDDWVNAYSETADLLSVADIQQSPFSSSILPLHQEAVRYGFYKSQQKPRMTLTNMEWKSPNQKDFYSWLTQQRNRKQNVKKSLAICEYAPTITVHRTETLSRLLFIADPDRLVTYWPTQSYQTAAEYEMANFEYETPYQKLAWRLVWSHVAQIVKETGKVPPRPASTPYRVHPVFDVQSVQCVHGVCAYEYCMVCQAHICVENVPNVLMLPKSACNHNGTAFQWCFVCKAAPTEPILRCNQNCKGWGSCCTCAAYNRIIAKIVTVARGLEKI